MMGIVPQSKSISAPESGTALRKVITGYRMAGDSLNQKGTQKAAVVKSLSAGLAFLVLAGCATPERVKSTSRQQGELLAEFKLTVETLKGKLLQHYDTRIEAFKNQLIAAKVDEETLRVKEALTKAIASIDPSSSQEEKKETARGYLNQASNYLVQLPKYYFPEHYVKESYCKDLKRLQGEGFLKSSEESCDRQHIELYLGLKAERERIADRFDKLVVTITDMAEAHAVIDRYLQIEFKLTEERVKTAKELIQKAKETVEIVKKELQSTEGGGE